MNEIESMLGNCQRSIDDNDNAWPFVFDSFILCYDWGRFEFTIDADEG